MHLQVGLETATESHILGLDADLGHFGTWAVRCDNLTQAGLGTLELCNKNMV